MSSTNYTAFLHLIMLEKSVNALNRIPFGGIDFVVAEATISDKNCETRTPLPHYSMLVGRLPTHFWSWLPVMASSGLVQH